MRVDHATVIPLTPKALPSNDNGVVGTRRDLARSGFWRIVHAGAPGGTCVAYLAAGVLRIDGAARGYSGPRAH